jgi:sugar phosphate permease
MPHQDHDVPSRLWSPNFPFAPSNSPFFYGWAIVAAGTLGIVFSIPGQTMGFTVFSDILIRELQLSRVQLSMAYCVGTVASGFTLPMLGRVFDRIGARKMVVGAAFGTGLVLFFLSQTARLADFLSNSLPGVSRMVVAFTLITIGFYLIRMSAQGVLTMTSRNAIGKWFDFRRGTALAISGVVTSFTFSIAPTFLNLLVKWFRWDGAWMVLGGLTIVVMGGIGWLFYRDNPEECGLVMDGPMRSDTRKLAHADSLTHRDFNRREALCSLPFWAFNLSFGFISLFSTAVTFHILDIGSQAGIEGEKILLYFVPMAFVAVPTNLLFGWLSPRVKLKYLLVVMNLAALALVLGTIYLPPERDWTDPGLLAFIIGNGICGGAFSALSGIVWPRFFGRRWLGSIAGIGMSSMVIASGLGPILFSVFKDHFGSYQLVFWVNAVIPAALVITSFGADNPQRKFAPSPPSVSDE